MLGIGAIKSDGQVTSERQVFAPGARHQNIADTIADIIIDCDGNRERLAECSSEFFAREQCVIVQVLGGQRGQEGVVEFAAGIAPRLERLAQLVHDIANLH